MDQFAAGLVGTRSPYGVPQNSIDARFIPGGSSSGSAVAVGSHLVSFALGTDTAGSGRVPAGLNGCIGVKGTVGKISTRGKEGEEGSVMSRSSEEVE
jgi:allophanate hydrolase